jgi:hypothetical protein
MKSHTTGSVALACAAHGWLREIRSPLWGYRRDIGGASVDFAHLVRECLSRLRQGKITNQDRTVWRGAGYADLKPHLSSRSDVAVDRSEIVAQCLRCIAAC